MFGCGCFELFCKVSELFARGVLRFSFTACVAWKIWAVWLCFGFGLVWKVWAAWLCLGFGLVPLACCYGVRCLGGVLTFERFVAIVVGTHVRERQSQCRSGR